MQLYEVKDEITVACDNAIVNVKKVTELGYYLNTPYQYYANIPYKFLGNYKSLDLIKLNNMKLYEVKDEVAVILDDSTILTVTNSHKPFDNKNRSGGYTISAPYRQFGNYPDISSVNKALDAFENDPETKKFFGTDNPEMKPEYYTDVWSNPEQLEKHIKTLESTRPNGMAHSLRICSELHLAKKRLKELE